MGKVRVADVECVAPTALGFLNEIGSQPLRAGLDCAAPLALDWDGWFGCAESLGWAWQVVLLRGLCDGESARQTASAALIGVCRELQGPKPPPRLIAFMSPVNGRPTRRPVGQSMRATHDDVALVDRWFNRPSRTDFFSSWRSRHFVPG
jgi:hypothetical protein